MSEHIPALRRKHEQTPLNWDLGLSVLETHAQPGRAFNYSEIADACGVSKQAVRQLIQKALRRVRFQLEKIHQ